MNVNYTIDTYQEELNAWLESCRKRDAENGKVHISNSSQSNDVIPYQVKETPYFEIEQVEEAHSKPKRKRSKRTVKEVSKVSLEVPTIERTNEKHGRKQYEKAFEKMLTKNAKALGYTIEREVYVCKGKYRVDFILRHPALVGSIFIEVDEQAHSHHIIADIEREDAIKKERAAQLGRLLQHPNQLHTIHVHCPNKKDAPAFMCEAMQSVADIIANGY